MSVEQNLKRRRAGWLRRRRAKRRSTAMSVLEHLVELRRRIVISLVAFSAISVAAFFLFGPILDFLLEPLCNVRPDLLGPQGCRLQVHSPVEPFTVRLKVTAMVAIVASSPVWLYQIWAFVVPGLTARERRLALPFMFCSTVLFLAGVTAAYVTLTPGLRFLIGLGEGELVPQFRADQYLNFVGLMFLGFGAMMELPMLLYFLGLAGVVTETQLRSQRKVALVVIVALAAVITPSQDPYTLLVLTAPLYLLYELDIFLLWLRARRARKREGV